MARLDRATQWPRVCAANEFCDRLGGPLLRAMTTKGDMNAPSAGNDNAGVSR
jgi:hypothetical protein